MDIGNLVGMANRIGDFFQRVPDRHEAKHDIALHITKFWEPLVRDGLIAKLHDATTEVLHALVIEAVKVNLHTLATQQSVPGS